MTDTETRPPSAGQFCGQCGAAVRLYWNSCPSCHSPLAVRPVGSYEPTVDDPAPTPAAGTPAPPEDEPSAWSTNGDSPRAHTPDAVPTPSGWSDSASAPRQSSGYPPSAYAGPSTDAAPSGYARSSNDPAPSGYARSSNDPAPSYAAPMYGPAIGSSWSPVAYPATTSYEQAYRPDAPSGRWSRRGTTPWVIAGVLAVLFLFAAGFGVTKASSASSANSHLSDARQALKSTQASLTAANAALGQAQSQLSDAKSTVSSQGDQITAFKACITDLSVADEAIQANSESQFKAAEVQVRKDCLPLGLS